MERTQQPGRVLIALALLLTSCSAGLEGGSTSTTFGGLTNSVVDGPQTVDLYWDTSSTCNSYQVFRLSANDSSMIATATVPPVRLNAATGGITSDTQYTFSVGCVQSDGTVSGLATTKVVNTWPPFTGTVTSALDLTGANPVVVLNWNYPAGVGTQYQVYAKLSQTPGDLSAWALAASGSASAGYSDTPICTTTANKIRVGTGGDCPSANLLSGQIYNFKVVAHYPDGTYSVDIQGNGTSQLMPASFTPPGCVLTQAGLGPDVLSSYLYLRCDAGTIGANVGTCPMARLSMKAYQAISGVKTPVSATLTGNGTLTIQPQISAGVANDRQVTGLEIDYTCNTTPASTSVIRYDGSNAQYPIPSLKYENAAYDGAPNLSAAQKPSHLGQSIAIGDFNCDGKPDLAVGMPLVTYNKAGDPFSSQNNETGMVKVYYDYQHTLTDYQIITFRDLPAFAHFGQSLAAGNINRDVHQSTSPSDSNFYSCDDLIIGAPGKPTLGNYNYTGASYIFYGQAQRFPSPLDSAGLATNAPTCTGNYNNEVCAPVKLLPTMTSNFQLAPLQVREQAASGANPSAFGFSVAYIRDFNADGYGDIAIGDPYCDWDGPSVNGGTGNAGAITKNFDVGCAYVFWGGPAGVQNVYVGNTPDNAATLADGTNKFKSPFVKIYPPIPQPAMHFGWSIAGGGDIDGRLPVPVQMNGTSNIILATGSDFVVGAPDYHYNNSSSYANFTGGGPGAANISAAWPGNSDTVDPIVTYGKAFPYSGNDPALGPANKISPPWNGAWAWSGQGAGASNWAGVAPTPANPKLQLSTGIAFAYLGRSAFQNYSITISDNAFHRYPNVISDASVSTPIDTYLSQNLQDRQNGSQYLSLTSVSGANSWKVAPVLSFYNCGNRGAPGSNDGTANHYYTHYSCLAGRNNFSVIYPMLRSTDDPVKQFGLNVAIAGAPEQNAIALYNLGAAASASAYERITAGSNTALQPLGQGNVHSSIRGVSEWEIGVKGLNVDGLPATDRTTQNTTCEVFQLGTSQNPDPTSNCTTPGTYMASLSRSALKESYAWSLAGTGFNSAPAAVPTNDINRDGYADILVSTGQYYAGNGVTDNASVYTYFGNYAADFSYSDVTAGGGYGATGSLGGCTVNRLTTNSVTGFAANNPGPTPAPFTTFATAAAGSNVAGTKDWWLYGEYPAYQLTDPDTYQRLSFLGDVTSAASTTISFSYPAMNRTGATIGNTCYPQRNNSYLTAPSSLATADLNNDGVIDGIVGLQNDSLNTGKTIVSYASSGSTTFGLNSDNPYTDGATPSSLAGTTVTGVNWKYIDESVIRDLLVGAIGFTNGTTPGAGRILDYTGASTATLSSTSTSHFDDDNNSPNNLYAQYAKIVGDINGDGYEDILIPVKRFNPSGGSYYDGILYFGSPFGPITTTVCNAKKALIFKTAGGALIDQSAISSDCEASTGGGTAVLGGVLVRLPQYIASPSNVNPNWILSAYAAGDVDGDGKGDVVIIDNQLDTTAIPAQIAGAYLFYGTETGLKNGAPAFGASADHAPQLITQNGAILLSSTAQSSYSQIANLNNAYGRPQLYAPYAMSNVAIVHGDFNGDGYADIAIGVPGLYAPTYGGTGATAVASTWHCSATTAAGGIHVAECGNASLGVAPISPGPAPGGHGGVVIFYGGPHGVQTPLSTTTGLPTDFDIQDTGNPSMCTDFYGNCKYGAKLVMDTARETYGSMTITNGAVTINTASSTNPNGAACDPTTGNCYASVIRNPVYFDDPSSTGDAFINMGSMQFGSALTVADMNGDGIDDLVVGFPNFSHINYPTANTGGPYGGSTIFGGTGADPTQKGSVMVYYGAKGAGVVAPSAKSYMADLGMGLSNATTANPNNPVFSLYPILASSLATSPQLDQLIETGRQFGINVTSGDFNGDGFDDIAVSSGNGQVYVYYGPICNIDNNKTAWWSGAYAARNIAVPITSVLGSGLGAHDCSLVNLSGTYASNNATASAGSLVQASRKTLFPQTIYLNGTTVANGMASILLSKRPIHTIPTSSAPSTVVTNPGNMNGDPEATSELIIGTYLANDPNANISNGKTTGTGYVLFGHKDPNAGGTMHTLPGLYVGNPTYNSAVTSSTVAAGAYYTGSTAGTYYYYSPLLLKPHASDGSVEKFWLYPVTMGDLNGDGNMDLLMTTDDIQFTTGGTPTVNGGGFKLFY